MNQTLAIIKPDAMKKGNMENIKKDIIDNGFNIENGAKITVDNGDIICGNVNGIREQVPDPDGRVGLSLIQEHY